MEACHGDECWCLGQRAEAAVALLERGGRGCAVPASVAAARGDVADDVVQQVDGLEDATDDVELDVEPVRRDEQQDARRHRDAAEDGALLAVDGRERVHVLHNRHVDRHVQAAAHHKLHQQHLRYAAEHRRQPHPQRVPHKRHLVRHTHNDVCWVPAQKTKTSSTSATEEAGGGAGVEEEQTQ